MKVCAQRWMAALAAFAIIAGGFVVANTGSCAIASGHELVGLSCSMETLEAPALWMADVDRDALPVKELLLLLLVVAIVIRRADVAGNVPTARPSIIARRHAALPTSFWKFTPSLATHGF